MNRILACLGLVGLLGFCASGWADEASPSWSWEPEEGSLVGYEAPAWHAKDYGWLLTFRLTTGADQVLRPVCYLRFEGKDADGEIVWTGSKTVRRRDLDASIQGGKSLFVRMAFRDVPDTVATMVARFENGPPEASVE